MWNTTTGQLSPVVPDRPLTAAPSSFSLDGRWLLTSSTDRSLHGQYVLWDVATGGRIADLPAVFTPEFSPTEPLLALVAERTSGHSVRLLELPSLRVRAEMTGTGGPVAFSPDGRLLATTDGEDHITIWSVNTARRVAGVPAANLEWGWLAFTPDSRRLIVAVDNLPTTGLVARQLEISVWDPTGGQEVLRILDEHALPPRCPGVLLTAAAGQWKGLDTECRLKGYDLTAGGLRYDVKCPLNFIDRPVYVAAGGRWQAVEVFDLSFIDRCRQWLAERGVPLAASLNREPAVLLIDPYTGRRVARMPGLRGPILSADGRTLAAHRKDGTVELWDVPPRTPVSWLLTTAALLALLLAWLAHRRVRQLRRVIL
jgi:hypothetical protein